MRDKKFGNPFSATLNGIIELYSNKGEEVNLPENIDLSGKHVMITGSSAGLGLATAKRVAKAGAQLSMAVRSGIPDKGHEVEGEAGVSNVKMYYVDLSDFESINSFLNQLVKNEVKLDIFIANAAMVPLVSRQTKQGLEEMFMVNYLSTFYLINELLSRKIISTEAASKIIIISSESHRDPAAFDWEGFGKYEPYGIKEVIAKYGYYKLLLTTFANELSRRINTDKSIIPVRVLCPGPVNSNIAREAPGWMQPLLKGVFSLFFRSPMKAADPVVYFCQEAGDQPIDYLYLLQKKPMAPLAQEMEDSTRLWERSEALIRELGYKVG
ncbi:MAG: SDR family NAD(P)-dependent oxidoreductase [Cyclobacteriaceae bacterium]